MKWMRSVGCVLAAGVLVGLGCTREPEPREPPAPVIDSEGDWTDTGRYASCTANLVGTVCGERSTVDVAGCDTASLASLPADGVYTLVYRSDNVPITANAGSFRVSADGHLDSFRGGLPTKREVGSDHFFLSSTRQTSATVTLRNSLVGCRAEGTRLYGCYVNCRNDKPTGWGTFLAERWTRRAGEGEASGLSLLSESFVELGLPVDIYVTKGHAYVVSIRDGSEAGGLSVFDVSNPAAPVLKKTISLPTDNYWNGVWARDNALYVASADTGAMVFDLANPAAPVLLRAVPSGRGPLNVHTVFVEGDRLYAMSPSPTPQTFVFDIREPTEPALLGGYAEPGSELSSSPGYPHDALAFEGRLYINHWADGYLIVDVSDPGNAYKLGTFKYPYATSHANAVGRFGERLIAFEGGESWGAHLRVLDVTDPAQPRRIGEYKLGENVSTHNMVLVGQRLYLAHYQHGVRVLDVSVPETPRQVAYFNTFRESDSGRGESFYDGALGIRVPGDGYVYVIDSSRGLLVFPDP